MLPQHMQTFVQTTQLRARPATLALGEQLQLQRGRTHEITGAAADMFAVLCAAKQASDVIWIGLGRDVMTLCPTGLQAHIEPARLIIIQAVSRGELLWATDQALRAEGGFCVIADLPDALSLKESRRLQLAVEQGGGLGLLLMRMPVSVSAAQTRWRCEARLDDDPSWVWSCIKGKNGESGTWNVTHQGGQNAKDTLHMAVAASP
jgi:protein ImuA